MPKLKYSEKDRQRALKLYKAGMSAPKVEAITGIHKASVQKWARDEGFVRSRSTIDLLEKEKKEIIELYVKQKNSTNQISVMMGIPTYQIFYFLRKKGLTRSPNEARRIRAKREKLKSIK